VTLSTKFFQGLAIASAKGRGMSSLPQVILPWPYDTLEDSTVREIAYRALDEVVRALVVPNKGVVEVSINSD